jgi:hypothetical protein
MWYSTTLIRRTRTSFSRRRTAAPCDRPRSSSAVSRPTSSLGIVYPILSRAPRSRHCSGFALPDGTVFIVANNQSIIYDVEKNTERILPDVPNNVRVTNPVDGSAILLPLSPPDYVPEVLVCGGSALDTTIPVTNLSSQAPATSQCSRITLTEAGIEKGWEVEHMLGGRIMPELVHLPNGQVLITNGGRTGFAAVSLSLNPHVCARLSVPRHSSTGSRM